MLTVGPSKESIEALTASIIEILECDNDEETIRIALKVLAKGVAVNYTTIENCNFVNGDYKETE